MLTESLARFRPMTCVECGDERPEPEAIHASFGLTYANYLVLARSKLQSMPDEWQARFVAMLADLHAAFDVEEPYGYRVQAVDAGGRFVRDPIPHYDRGRTRIALASSTRMATIPNGETW